MKSISLAFLLLVTSSFALAAEGAQKDIQSKSKNKTVATAAESPWIPEGIPAGLDQLPPNYKGLDPKKFLYTFKSRVDGLKKGEFETTEEFNDRIKNKDAILAPFNTHDLYAFFVNDAKFKYDADKQVYNVMWSYPCQDTYSFGKDKGWVTCKIARIDLKKSTYIGQNSYGAKVEVTRFVSDDFSIAFPIKDDSLSFFEDRSISKRYGYKDTISLPLEKARGLSEFHIGAIVICSITDARIVEGKGLYAEATISDPTESVISDLAIPFKIRNIVYYVVETGEILKRRQ